VLIKAGPEIWLVLCIFMYRLESPEVLIVPVTWRVAPVKVDAVRAFTLAIVAYRGKPKVFTTIHVVGSWAVKVRAAFACDVCMLLVPSRKRIPFIVLTMIVWGVER